MSHIAQLNCPQAEVKGGIVESPRIDDTSLKAWPRLWQSNRSAHPIALSQDVWMTTVSYPPHENSFWLVKEEWGLGYELQSLKVKTYVLLPYC